MRIAPKLALVVFATLLFAASAAFTAQAESSAAVADRTAHAAGSAEKVARSVASLTGAAYQPILGAALVGGWTYWVTREEERANLPFFSQPWFVILCAGLYFAICAKASLGVFPLLKKPLDALSLFGNYIGGAIVILPMLHQIALEVRGGGSTLALWFPLTATVYAAEGAPAQPEPTSWFVVALVVILAAAAAFAVWLFGNLVYAAILVNPIPFLDFLLLGASSAVLVTLLLTAWFFPFVGLALSLVLIAISIKLAGWSYRWSVLAAVFSWDICTLRKDLAWGRDGRLRAFSDQALDLPPRTMGHLTVGADDALGFTYRAFLVGPRRTLAIERQDLALGRTLTHPCLIRQTAPGADYRLIARLAPRYRKHADPLGRAMGVPMTDIGLRGAWRWCKAKLRELRSGPAQTGTAAA